MTYCQSIIQISEFHNFQNFHITYFPFLSSNIPSSPAYGVFFSQLIRYARACSSYECLILRAARLLCKLLRQGYVRERLKSSHRKFYGRYGDLIKHYEVSLCQCYMTFWDMIIYSPDQSKVKRFRFERSTAQFSRFVIFSLTN